MGTEEVGGNLDTPLSGVDGAVEALDLVSDFPEADKGREMREA